jgi:hypothetical protein
MRQLWTLEVTEALFRAVQVGGEVGEYIEQSDSQRSRGHAPLLESACAKRYRGTRSGYTEVAAFKCWPAQSSQTRVA